MRYILSLIFIPIILLSASLFHETAFALGFGDMLNNVSPETKAMVVTKLDPVKLKVCELKETAIKTRVKNIETMVTKKIEDLRAISTTAQTYYTTLLVPLGATIENYDALIADVQADEAAVHSSLEKAKNDVVEFTCTGEDPKGQLTLYKSDMKAVVIALLDYKTSVKNLMVEVNKTAAKYQSVINSVDSQGGTNE